jgi:hypothetical protein
VHAVQSIETWLLVPTLETPQGLMRVAENDGRPVLYAPAAPVAPAEPQTGLVEKLLRRLGAAR